MTIRVAIMTTGDPAAAILVNAVCNAFPSSHVLLEEPEPKSSFLKRRARKIGWPATLHQLPVMVLGKLFKRFTNKRYAQIEAAHNVSMTLKKAPNQTHIGSVNSHQCLGTVQGLKPDVILLVGTRMLSAKTLNALNCPVINFHAGFNPRYRGLNGGYWALSHGDAEHYGGTVHYVDAGVDTGATIARHQCKAERSDNILTHQHQISAQCVSMVIDAIDAILNNTATTVQYDEPSRQWYHPTLAGYLWRGMVRGIW